MAARLFRWSIQLGRDTVHVTENTTTGKITIEPSRPLITVEMIKVIKEYANYCDPGFKLNE